MREISLCNDLLLLVIIKDKGVRSMVSIPGSLHFAKLVMTSSTTANLRGMPDKRPKIHSLPHTISTPNVIGHFRVAVNLVMKARLRAKFL